MSSLATGCIHVYTKSSHKFFPPHWAEHCRRVPVRQYGPQHSQVPTTAKPCLQALIPKSLFSSFLPYSQRKGDHKAGRPFLCLWIHVHSFYSTLCTLSFSAAPFPSMLFPHFHHSFYYLLGVTPWYLITTLIQPNYNWGQSNKVPPPQELCLSLTQLTQLFMNVLSLRLDDSVITTCSYRRCPTTLGDPCY